MLEAQDDEPILFLAAFPHTLVDSILYEKTRSQAIHAGSSLGITLNHHHS